jgi:hypothetical protein
MKDVMARFKVDTTPICADTMCDGLLSITLSAMVSPVITTSSMVCTQTGFSKHGRKDSSKGFPFFKGIKPSTNRNTGMCNSLSWVP